jgi:outer membrane protein OmpA-like peptidoglycan-associated protein
VLMPRLRSPAIAIGFASILAPAAAHAGDVSVLFEPGAAIPLTAPQADIYDVGGGQTVRGYLGLTSYLDVGPSISFLYLPSPMAGAEAGIAWGFGAGARLKRPHDRLSAGGISPWLALDALYVRTGDLDRPGLDAAVGLSIPIGEERAYWIGPFARFTDVMQGNPPGFDNRDAKVLSLGVSFEVGPRMKRRSVADQIRTVEKVREVQVFVPKEVIVTKEVSTNPDRDQDQIADSVDRCPDAPGLGDNWGCPAYKKLVVQPDKLELKEKLYFRWDEATLEDASYPVLDEVVTALQDNPGFSVEAQGHTDSSGQDDHNQDLSEQRAQAVLDYLRSKGVAEDRLRSKGFSSSEPSNSNKTKRGRKANRRVEFVVSFMIVDQGGGK